MKIFKRAKTSIMRNLGKSVILLFLVFTLGTIIAGALAVEGAVTTTEENLRRNMPAVVSIGIDEQQVIDYYFANGEFPEITAGLTAELIRTIGALPYIREFNYSMESFLMSFEIDNYLPTLGNVPPMGNQFPHFPSFFDVAGLSGTNLIPLNEGVIELVGGGMLTEAQIATPDGSGVVPVLVSDDFARTNHLSVGSIFALSDKIPQGEDSGLADSEIWLVEHLFAYEIYEFEIVGLFDLVDKEAIESGDFETYQLHRSMLNQIYVPNWFVEQSGQSRASARQERAGEEQVDFEPTITSIFILEDPREIEDFRRTVEPMLPDFVAIDDLTNTFEAISSSMGTLLEIADWVLWIAIGATFLILSLLLTLFLRDRRYEMGIYLALGEKKGKVIAQILLEIIAVSVVGITIAVFAGTVISSNLSQMMLRNALTVENNPSHSGGGSSGMVFMVSGSTSIDAIGFGGGALSPDEMIEAFDLSLTGQTIFIFYIIALVAVVVSTLIPIVYLIKLSPKKILMMR